MTLQYILTKVFNYYGIPIEKASSKSRKANLSKARHVYFYLATKHTKFSLEKIGFEVDRDHATVMHGKKRIRYDLLLYPIRLKEIEEIESTLSIKNSLEVEHIDLLQLAINHTNSFI